MCCVHIHMCVGTRRIDVSWIILSPISGVIERYILYMSVSHLNLPGEIVYNSSDVGFLSYRNESLQAGTTYYVTLSVRVPYTFWNFLKHPLVY